VDEAADAFQTLRRGAPCGLDFAWVAGEAAVVVGEEDTHHDVGRIDIAGLSQAEFASEAILEHAPEAFDSAFGLRTAGGDEGDAELFEDAADLRGLTLA
jgi:hypothetical protein